MSRVTRVLIEKDVVVPLRDGVRTLGDLYRPAEGPPVPALVCRIPYNKEVELRAVSILPSPAKLAERGYAVLVVDVRGRFASEGTFVPFANEGRDGYDTVEWAAAQPWCDGKVGIYGPSYLGAAALLAARERPPSLRCAVPIITADDYFNDWVYRGGAFQLGFAGGWARGLAAATAERLSPEARQRFIQDVMGSRSEEAIPDLWSFPGMAVEGVAPWWSEWLEHDRRDGYWVEMSPSRDYSEYDLPMLHIGGWWDLFIAGTVRNFQGLVGAGAPDQHLWIGPWAHTHFDQYFGEIDLGPSGSAAGSGTIAAFNRFVDQHLKGGPPRLPVVHYYLLGRRQWRDAAAWPPPETEPCSLFLRSGGRANSARGDGRLSSDPPAAERRDRFVFDPERPVPSLEPAGPTDRRPVEARDDVLCYTTEPMTVPLTVAGPVDLDVWVVTDAEDTDWTAALVDVQPDGRALTLCDTVLRARYHESLSEPRPLEPGRPHCLRIRVGDIACQLGPGHRLRLEVSSSSYPKYLPNPGTAPRERGIASRPAIQEILHDPEHRSRLELRVIPESEAGVRGID